MCGRFSVNKEQVEDWVTDHWDISFSCESNKDLRPTQQVSTLIKVNDNLSQLNTQWGIKPSWYEWRNEGGKRKLKYVFHASSNQVLLMAGIWYETESVPQLVTLTTRPNSRCGECHKRMPVLIDANNMGYWFNSDVEQLQPLLEPIASDLVTVALEN